MKIRDRHKKGLINKLDHGGDNRVLSNDECKDKEKQLKNEKENAKEKEDNNKNSHDLS